MFLCSGLLCLSGCFTACSGNSDDSDPSDNNNTVEGPLTLSVNKTEIEANGEDVITFTVKDANGKVLTTPELIKNVYIEDKTTGDYLERRTNVFSAIENGTHVFKAYYEELESQELTITAKNREKYEVFYHKIAVFKMTGTWCVACPAMTSGLHKVEEAMPGRMVKMAFHASSSSEADPFHLDETGALMTRFGASGFPTCVYDLNTMSIERTVSGIKALLLDEIKKHPATCGIKLSSSYDATSGEIKVNASLTSSKGGEYDLAYVLVTDGLTASGGREEVYDYTVRAISSNYMAMSTNRKFTVEANQEHQMEEFTIIAKGLSAETSRVVVYALRKVDGTYMVDNITECPIQGSIGYIYNK